MEKKRSVSADSLRKTWKKRGQENAQIVACRQLLTSPRRLAAVHGPQRSLVLSAAIVPSEEFEPLGIRELAAHPMNGIR